MFVWVLERCDGVKSLCLLTESVFAINPRLVRVPKKNRIRRNGTRRRGDTEIRTGSICCVLQDKATPLFSIARQRRDRRDHTDVRRTKAWMVSPGDHPPPSTPSVVCAGVSGASSSVPHSCIGVPIRFYVDHRGR